MVWSSVQVQSARHVITLVTRVQWRATSQGSANRLAHVGNEIVRLFEAHRQTQHPLAYSDPGPLLFADVPVGCAWRDG